MDSNQEKQSNFFTKLNSLWGLITEPSKSITDPIHRFKAKLVITTIEILIVLIILSVLAQSDLSPLVLIVLIIGYFLSRTKYYVISAFLVITNISFFVMYALFGLSELTKSIIFMTIAWFTPSLILAGLIFSIREMLVISILHFLFPLLFLVYNPELEFRTVFVSLGYISVVSSMILVNMRLRDLLEMERQKEIRNRNIELEARVQDRTAELEAFSYSISHDLRAPLRHIAGFGQILEENFSDKLGLEGKGYLQRIITSVNRLSILIDDLLKLSRIYQQEIIKRNVNISEMVHKISENLKQSSIDRDIEVVIAEGVTVQADDNLIRIALENLISNAWKFTRMKSPALIEFGVNYQNGQSVYFIKDNGIGFDQAYSKKAFEPFQRLHNKAEYKGTGIGLAIVKRIIDMHLGRIWVESEVNKGATFYFTLG